MLLSVIRKLCGIPRTTAGGLIRVPGSLGPSPDVSKTAFLLKIFRNRKKWNKEIVNGV